MDNAGQSQVEEGLRALAASYRHMAENVPGAMLRYRLRPDGTDQVVWMSPRCLDVWEVEAEAILNDANILEQPDPRCVSERGLAAGFLADLTKPLDIGRLLAIVDEASGT